MPRIPRPRASSPTKRLPGLRGIAALFLVGSIVIGGMAAPRLAAAKQASSVQAMTSNRENPTRLAAVHTSSDHERVPPHRPEPPKPAPPRKSTRGGAISRAEVIHRAKYWFDNRGGITYSWTSYHHDPDGANHTYRQDCSGFVSMALHLTNSLSTVTLPGVGNRISRTAMQPGDFTGVLGNGTAGAAGHVRIFEKWANKSAGTYWAYDFGSTPVKHQIYKLSTDTPRNGIGWTAYRYKEII